MKGRSLSLFWRLYLANVLAALVSLVVLAMALTLVIGTHAQEQRNQQLRLLAARALQAAGPADSVALARPLVVAEPGRGVILTARMLGILRAGRGLPAAEVVAPAGGALSPAAPAADAAPGQAGGTAPEQPAWVASTLQEVTDLARGLSEREFNGLVGQGKAVTHFQPHAGGSGRKMAVLLPLDPLPITGRLLVAFVPAGQLDEPLADIWRLLALTTLVALAAAALLAWALARGIAAPLQAMAQVARRGGRGDLSRRVESEPPGELGQVVQVFNQAVDEMAGALRQQQELERTRRELMASVSHEFRAPLASLRGYLELMQEGVIRPDEQGRYVGVMLDDTLRLNRLVEDLLDLARLHSGQVTLRVVPVDAAEAWTRAVDQLQWQLQSSGVELTVAPAAGLPAVAADPDRLVQVLANLLENAVRFTPPGGRVTLSVAPVGEHLRFAVQDTGPGIPWEEQARVWERFYQVEKARTPRSGSAGLGLAIVRELVQAMHGQVGVESEPSRGATFWFTLPLAGGVGGVATAAGATARR